MRTAIFRFLIATICVVAVGRVIWVIHKEYSLPVKTYQVKITYCDSRPPKIIECELRHYPTNESIQSDRNHPIPRFAGELNVCAIEVVP